MSEERRYRPRFNKRSKKEFAHSSSADRTRASKRDKEDIPHTTSKGTGVKRTTSLKSQKRVYGRQTSTLWRTHWNQVPNLLISELTMLGIKLPELKLILNISIYFSK